MATCFYAWATYKSTLNLLSARESEQQATASAHARMQSIFDSAPVGITFSSRGELEFANPKALEMLSIHPGDDILGFYAEPERRLALTQRLERGETLSNLEFQMKDRDGNARDMLVTLLPITLNQNDGVLGWLIDISERKRMEDALRMSEEKYRSLIDQSSTIVLEWGPDGTVLYLNPYGLAFFGFSEAEIVGRNVVGTIVAPLDSSGHDLQEKMVQVQTEPDSFPSSENENIRKSGEGVWVAWSNKGVLDAQGNLIKTVSFGIDRTRQHMAEQELKAQYHQLQDEIIKRQQAEALLLASQTQLEQRVQERTEALTHANQALQESEAHFRALSDNSLLGIYQQQDGRFAYVNAALAKTFGYTPEELIGADIQVLIPPEDRDQVAERLRRQTEENSATIKYEFRGRHKSGEIRDIEIYSVRVQQNGLPTVVGALLDITERKHASEKLANAYESLQRSLQDTIATIAKIVEMRDPYTAGHQERVAKIAVAIAQEMGLEPERIERLRMAAMIHDIGKIGIPAEMLSKPGKLTQLEHQIIKTHAERGYEIVSHMNLLPGVAQIIRQHHERIDGSGYPQGLKGDDILLEARILGVADTIEAMATHRPYRPALGIQRALAEISQSKGQLFDATVCDAGICLFTDKGFSVPE